MRPFHKDLDIVIVMDSRDLRTHDCKMHTIVRVALSRHKGHQYKGRIVEVFPSLDDPELEREIVAEMHGFPTTFSENALEEAESQKSKTEGKRIDLTHATIVTIDGETAKDFDDAIGVEITREGNYLLTVSIADVSHYVTEGSALDREAAARGCSVYLPGFVYPMLPEELSNNLCSLVPFEERLCLTCESLISKTGKVLKTRFYPSKIRSQARLTYTTVSRVIEKGQTHLVSSKIGEMLDRAYALAKLIRADRLSRGSLDLDIPETELVLETDGSISEVREADRNEAHRLIEDFMIFANERVSEAIEQAGLPSIYRVHEDPDPLKLERLQQVVKRWGIKIKSDSQIIERLQKYLEDVRGHENEKILMTSLLRSMKQAQYSPVNVGHFGLASKSYTHFTSPIRRYPDLIIHRILRRSDFLRSKKPPYTEEQLQMIAKLSSEYERRAFVAERDLKDMKKMRFMEKFVGKKFEAVVTSIKHFGMFVELRDFPVDGLVPIRWLPSDDWNVDELETCISGSRRRQAYFLGDSVKVQIADVDRYKRQMSCRLVDSGEQERPHKRRR